MFKFVDESSIFRAPPILPYTETGHSLILSQSILASTYDLLSDSADRRKERCAFWYGNESDHTVRLIFVPKQQSTWGNYYVPGWAMQEGSKLIRKYGYVNLAQIHTHPGSNIEHSPFDDEMANSQNAFSIVLPRYAAVRTWPFGIGLHEYQNGYWHLLPEELVEKKIQLSKFNDEPQIIDLR